MGSSAGPLIALQAAGSIAGAYGSYQAGQANSRASRLTAQQYRIQAEQAIQGGEFEAGVRDLQETQTAGRLAAGSAAGGVIAGAGTEGARLASSEALSETDKNMIRLNARRQAHGFTVEAGNADYKAKMDQWSGNMGAITSLLGGAGQIAATSKMFSGSGSTAPQVQYA